MNEEFCRLYRELDEAHHEVCTLSKHLQCSEIHEKICAAMDRAEDLLAEADIQNDGTDKIKAKIYQEIARIGVIARYEKFFQER